MMDPRRIAAVLAATLALLTMHAWQASAQKAYPSADAAATAFIGAVESRKPEDIQEVLGANWREFIPTDEVDEEDVAKFLAGWAKAHAIVPDGEAKALISVGTGGWILPIPVTKSEQGWSFDVVAGSEEMRARRIGRNELATIEAVRAYHDAQLEYAEEDRNDDGMLEYAQRIVSTPGETDGLYWARLEDEEESPLGPLFGGEEIGDDFHGYQYRILTAQGPAAKGGAYEYMVGKRLSAGFALVAWPSKYADTGVMSFIVNQDGVVYQADLGPETDATARAIKTFNPDSAWSKVEPEELEREVVAVR